MYVHGFRQDMYVYGFRQDMYVHGFRQDNQAVNKAWLSADRNVTF